MTPVRGRSEPSPWGTLVTDYMRAHGWLTKPERHLLHDTAAEVEHAFPGDLQVPLGLVMVNIGVEYGASLHCLRAGSPNAHLVGVDLDVSKMEGNPFAELIQGDSGAEGAVWDLPVHLLFVDGDHTARGIARDLASWVSHVVPGGYLLLHDYSLGEVHHEEVVKVVDAWAQGATQDWEFVSQCDSTRVYRRRKPARGNAE